jgi:hypothetical protein
VRELVPRDNEIRVKHVAPKLITIPEVLHGLGLIEDMERVWMTVERNGERAAIELRPVAGEADVEWVDGADDPAAPVPLWLRDHKNKFWFEYLADHETLYVQYNSVRDKPEETVAAFFGRLFAFADARPVSRFVLDIRHNGGGNGYLNRPIIHGLIRRQHLDAPGRLFTIVGRATFSAAMMLTVDLEKHTHTLFVGEPTGTSPNMYGENSNMALPNSGLELSVSSEHWVYSDPRDARPWLAPDIPVGLSSEHYRARRDPALEAILRHEPSEADAQQVAYPDRLYRLTDELKEKPERYTPEPPFA